MRHGDSTQARNGLARLGWSGKYGGNGTAGTESRGQGREEQEARFSRRGCESCGLAGLDEVCSGRLGEA